MVDRGKNKQKDELPLVRAWYRYVFMQINVQ